MLTGDLWAQIDAIWNDFWSNRIANPLQVIEQLTFLIFIKRLDEMQEGEERKATATGVPLARNIFPEGFDGIAKRGDPDERGEPYEKVRWSRFKHEDARTMFCLVIARGLMDAGLLYESPFNDYGPNGVEEVFAGADVVALVQVLKDIDTRSAA